VCSSDLYICRGGPSTKEESAFDFYFAESKTNLTPLRTNDQTSDLTNFDGNYPAGNANKGPYLKCTCTVGSYFPNPMGIYDMHGNVREWTSSMEDSTLVVRGGSWDCSGQSCSAANRSFRSPGYRSSLLGFRLLAVPIEE